MTTTTILAAGTTAATSSDVTVAAGATVTIAMFVSSGSIGRQSMHVFLDSPGEDVPVTVLDSNQPAVQLQGPGTYRVVRDACDNAMGAESIA